MPSTITAGQVFLQAADHGLEVAVADSARRPSSADMRRAWKARQGGRPAPVVVAVGYPGANGLAIALCGPAGDEPPVYFDLDQSRVERLAGAALAEPTRHAAQRCLLRLLPEMESELPGLFNSGMLATHELRHGVPQRDDWRAATAASRKSLPKRGRPLVESLGFTVSHLGTNTSLLTAGSDKRAVAVFLDEGETFEAPASRFDGVSPVSHALATASREGIPWVLLTRASEIRLYAARPDTGVGRRGPSQTFIEANLALLPEDSAGYLSLLFSADALSKGGTFDEILASSADFAADLATRLRERVYREAVPALASAIAARLAPNPSDGDLTAAYDRTLNILFRLLFIAYGEDKDLLPYDTNSRYAENSLKRLARNLSDGSNAGTLKFDEQSTSLWDGVAQIWDAVRVGNSSWGVPAYNGGLFSNDPETSPIGAALSTLSLTDAEFGPALASLLVDSGEGDADTVGPVDFRSLSVREFGTIYEGLLESELSVSASDLAVNRDGNYVPAAANDQIVVRAGVVYLHNRSGDRKSTGSYFTKPFAVEHLLDYALEPALDEHLLRVAELLDAGDEAGAATVFFDFRCADIAMGSGHFLVAAVDRIEARLSAFLALNPIPAVTAELDRLRLAAIEALGELADGVEIETTSLLRRQVGRRCIYGVDRNSIAVELARLAIWIHTFVPGLPLSFLDHNLVTGDSLVGIASIEEALTVLGGGDTEAPTLFRDEITGFLTRSSAALTRLAAITDATVADVKAAQAAHHEALEQVEPATMLFDLLVAARFGEAPLPVTIDEDAIRRAFDRHDASTLTTDVAALHFPVAFPEVFLRERAGFDCLLGNPPWDKVLFEAQQFWVTRFAGLNALPDSQREAKIVELRRERPDDAATEERAKAERERLQGYIEKSYPNRGSGHYDFVKVFTERALSLLHPRSALGYVLPANSLLLGGWRRIRALMLSDARVTVAQARNRGGWLFDDVEPRTPVAFVTRIPAASVDEVLIWPGLTTPAEIAAVTPSAALRLDADAINELSDAHVIPWLNSSQDLRIFTTMQVHPKLVDQQGWIQGSHDARWDFRSSGPNRRHSSDNDSPGGWKILMTRHVVPFGINDTIAFQRFIPSPLNLGNGVIRDVHGDPVLADTHPVVIVRHPSRNDDSRTMIAAALPNSGFLHNKGYVHSVRHAPGTPTSELLALLGFLNSFTCDWWVRRFADRHITAPVLNNVRLPKWTNGQIERAAALTARILIEGGTTSLAGARPLPPPADLSALDARIMLEVLAADGFELTPDDMETVLSDFSTKAAACPPTLRAAIIGAMR